MIQPEQLTIRVPASTANLGSGFDSIGVAFQLYLTITVEESEQTTRFIWNNPGLASLEVKDEDNLILQGMKRGYQLMGKAAPHFQITVESEIPLTRGLGSSASAYVAGLVIANEYGGHPFTDEDLLWFATEEEGHPDNVGASIFGGALIGSVDWSKKKVTYHQQPFPKKWRWVAAIPSYSLPTSVARELLPDQYPKQDAVFNVSRYGILVASLLTENEEGMIAGLNDMLHHPYRSHLIPGFEQLMERREELGVLGFVISGAGPTVLALLNEHANREQIMERMEAMMHVKNQTIETLPLAVDQYGYTVTTTQYQGL